ASAANLTPGFYPSDSYAYSGKDPSGYYLPPDAAANALKDEGTGAGWTETEPGGTQFRYDSSGKLTYARNPSGGRRTVLSRAAGRTSALLDPFGHRVTFSYDATTSRLRRITDASNRYTTYTRDATGHNIKRITTPDSKITTLLYDPLN